MITDSKTCKFCGVVFFRTWHTAPKQWSSQTKYCSKPCSDKASVGREPWNKGKNTLYNVGEKNNNWRGDNVGVTGIHLWVHKNKPRPDACENCGTKARLDAANISQEYKRNVDDWEYLCRKCHMTKDGRLAKWQERNYSRNKRDYLLNAEVDRLRGK